MAGPEAKATPRLRCPVCGSETFIAFNGRENARCDRCKSVERNRLLWMVLKAHGLFRPGQRVLHFAPEMALAKRFAELSGDRYHACDLNPERYGQTFVKVRRFDLCTDLEKLPGRSFDLILHSHVLEHLKCDVEVVLQEMERVLAPGGRHFLSVPISGETTREDLSDDLTPQHRAMMFGQDDHYRVFGTGDLMQLLWRVWGEDETHLIEPLELFTGEELTTAAIPPVAWTGLSSHSLLFHQRPLRPRPHPRPRAAEPEAPVAPAPSVDAASARLILHIGMPSEGMNRQRAWLRANSDALAKAELDTWASEPNLSELMFNAAADPERVARGRMWFQKDQDRADDPRRIQEAKDAFARYLDGLAGRTGLILAESLWTLQQREVAALAETVARHGVDIRIACWLRSPAEQLLSAARRHVRGDLGLDAWLAEVEREAPLKYDRLDAWISTFGRDRLTARLLGPGVVQELAALLAERGAQLQAPAPPTVDAPPDGPSLAEGKAILALNQRRSEAGRPKQTWGLLGTVLERLGGAPFAVPESLARRVAVAADAAYLADRLGFPVEEVGLERCAIDDEAFLTWSRGELGALLMAIDDGLREMEAASRGG